MQKEVIPYLSRPSLGPAIALRIKFRVFQRSYLLVCYVLVSILRTII